MSYSARGCSNAFRFTRFDPPHLDKFDVLPSVGTMTNQLVLPQPTLISRSYLLNYVLSSLIKDIEVEEAGLFIRHFRATKYNVNQLAIVSGNGIIVCWVNCSKLSLQMAQLLCYGWLVRWYEIISNYFNTIYYFFYYNSLFFTIFSLLFTDHLKSSQHPNIVLHF